MKTHYNKPFFEYSECESCLTAPKTKCQHIYDGDWHKPYPHYAELHNIQINDSFILETNGSIDNDNSIMALSQVIHKQMKTYDEYPVGLINKNHLIECLNDSSFLCYECSTIKIQNECWSDIKTIHHMYYSATLMKEETRAIRHTLMVESLNNMMIITAPKHKDYFVIYCDHVDAAIVHKNEGEEALEVIIEEAIGVELHAACYWMLQKLQQQCEKAM